MKIKAKIDESISYIRTKTDITPEIAIVLGTGLGALVNQVSDILEIHYSEIPNFPASTVETHAGTLVFGIIGNKKVVIMNGRLHYYEGYSMQEITFPIRVLKALGAKVLIISNAAGSMNPYYNAGDIMIITDHINLMGDNPLIGINDDQLGPRYPDMFDAYSPDLIDLAYQTAIKEKIIAHKGVLVAVSGPNLETPAEYKFLRMIGADAVSMSTVPEVIVAIHSSMKVLGLSCLTDKCTPEVLKTSDIGEIIQVANQTEPKLTKLVSEIIYQLSFD
ncbi:TPA: purine-nucleoside phosphorylase [bacterium]|nr:purine-nucleoside phosphorylase [bacterium]